MIYEHRSYRDYLKSVLAEKQSTNKRYSLRAMAKHLGYSSSLLSEVINNKANFSPTALKDISKKLKLSSAEATYLKLLGQFESEEDSQSKEAILLQLQKLNPARRPLTDLSVDVFKQMAEWYHSPILELLKLKEFEFLPANVAKTLGITKPEAELAIDRLERLELIARTADGKYIRIPADLQFKSAQKNKAMQSFYNQMFDRASLALEEQSPEERWSGYETLPIDEQALPEIREACDNFFEDVVRISKKYKNKKHVFHLMTHFFNLTKEK